MSTYVWHKYHTPRAPGRTQVKETFNVTNKTPTLVINLMTGVQQKTDRELIINGFTFRDARCTRRLLEVQIAEKASARALGRASGGMLPAERVFNKALLSRAAATLRLAYSHTSTRPDRSREVENLNFTADRRR